MAISHRTNRLKVIGNPSVEKLQNDRFRLTFNMTPLNPRNDWYNANKDRIFADFGSFESAEMNVDGIPPRTGEAYTNMRLVSVEAGNRSQVEGGEYIVQFVYETLGPTFVKEKDDEVDYELNGLRRVTRVRIAVAGTHYQKTVGDSSLAHEIDPEEPGESPPADDDDITLYLASYKIEDTDSFRRVTEVYLQPGTLSESIATGPNGLPNTRTRTVTSFHTVPTSSGITLSATTNNTNGFEQYEYRFLEKSDGSDPTSDNLVSYEKNIQVRDAGQISASSITVTGGTIASLNAVPPSIKTVTATVTISLETASTVATPVAYNLSNVSASAAITTTKVSPVGVEQGTSLTVSVFNTSATSKTTSFPNHYYTGQSVNASYSTPAQIVKDDDDIIGEALDENVDVDIILSGSNEAPATTGVYQEDLDPVFVDSSGTQHYRKTTYTINE